jgi:hypothetical protein
MEGATAAAGEKRQRVLRMISSRLRPLQNTWNSENFYSLKYDSLKTWFQL